MGSATLIIASVNPSCHCTTAGNWTHEIAPGQTGVIPIEFDGKVPPMSVIKEVAVISNAKNDPHASLRLKGVIWKPIDAIPQYAVISVAADATNSASTTVRILNQTDEPVTFSEPVSSSPSFTAELRANTNKPGKEYELIATALPPFVVGTTQGTITLKTSLYQRARCLRHRCRQCPTPHPGCPDANQPARGAGA